MKLTLGDRDYEISHDRFRELQHRLLTNTLEKSDRDLLDALLSAICKA